MEEGCYLSIYDPKVERSQIQNEFSNLSTNSQNKTWDLAGSVYEAVQGADALILLTEWEEFSNLNYEKISDAMNIPKWIFDTRNIVDYEKIKDCGFKLWNSEGNKKIKIK